MSCSKIDHSRNTGCDHGHLVFNLSVHAAEVGYHRPQEQRQVAAAETRRADVHNISAASFPAPLVLPDDDLSLDPGCPPQSVQSWLRLKDRNKVEPGKNVVYVAAPPDVASEVEFMRLWSHQQPLPAANPIGTPRVQDVVDYLAAFYYGLPVKLLTQAPLCFTAWDATASKASKARTKAAAPYFIGLTTSTECIRIRTRPSVDKVFARQLNLDDLLDVAMSVLPDDAYALLLLVEHDLFESVEDEFVCGRAYGGSRVAIISMARYNPNLDHQQNLKREHAWPASHCEAYVQACCAGSTQVAAPSRKKGKVGDATLNLVASDSFSRSLSAETDHDVFAALPMPAAVSAHDGLPWSKRSLSPAALSGLWLGRVCRTASHELGHCFGMEHCVYYACVMQGSASLAEDARQPPYLCPVDAAKLLRATGGDIKQHYSALLGFCNQYKNAHMFAAFAAWIRARLLEIETSACT